MIEDVLLASLSAVGVPVILIAHNPDPREGASALRARSQRLLTKWASAVVVHSDQLGRTFPTGVSPRRVVRCCHPPFSAWSAQPIRSGDSRFDTDDRTRVLFLGSLRPDKGSSLLPQVLARLSEEQRRDVTLVICGRGDLSPEFRGQLEALGVTLDDRTSSGFLPDHEVRVALAQSSVLLAPYVGATQSSTVAAALAMGVPVLAFNEGAIGEIVTDAGLVQSGDTRAMGLLLAEALAGITEVGRSRVDVVAWERACQDDWLAALNGVRTRN